MTVRSEIEELDRLFESCSIYADNGSRPIYVFKDDKIIIIESDITLVAGAWPDPTAWYKTRSKSWCRTCKWANEMLIPNLLPFALNTASDQPDQMPDCNIINPNASWACWFARRQEAFRSYARTFPEEVLSAALRFSNGWWHMICFMALGKGAVDLVWSNPALAYCLVNSKKVRNSSGTYQPVPTRSLVQMRQRDILDWLGFQNPESVRKIMQKITPAELTIANLLRLRIALRNERAARLLSHLPQINNAVLSVVHAPVLLDSLSNSALIDLAGQAHCADYTLTRIREMEVWLTLRKRQLFNSIGEMNKYYSCLSDVTSEIGIYDETYESDITRIERILNLESHGVFDSPEEITRYHDRLTKLLKHTSHIRADVPETLPAPPYKGSPVTKDMGTPHGN